MLLIRKQVFNAKLNIPENILILILVLYGDFQSCHSIFLGTYFRNLYEKMLF